MKLQPYQKGAAVRLTNPKFADDDFQEKFEGFSDEWIRFWNEYQDRTLYVKDAKEHKDDWDGRMAVYLDGLPDYVDHNIPFYSDEIDGVINDLPEELFTL